MSKGDDFSQLPPAFLAYQSNGPIPERMSALANEMNEKGAQITTWQHLTNPGLLFTPIAATIERCPLFLAEVTHGNPNVLFEVGYAIGRRKHVILFRDDNVRSPTVLPPLDLIRRVDYSARIDIVRYLSSVDLSLPPILDQLGKFADHDHSGLYFVPSRRGGDFNESVLSVCREGLFTPKVMDTRDTDFDSLTSQTSSISDADLFLTLLVSKDTKAYWHNNAQAMLFAGIAAGMQKEYVVLIQEPYRRLLDLGDRIIRFESDRQLTLQLRRWLTQTAATLLKSPKPPVTVAPLKRSALDGLFMGNLDARADFDLSAYFIETPEFRQAESGNRHLFSGAKGAGKTANFEILHNRLSDRNLVLVAIAPADFEFPHLAAVFAEHLTLARWEFVYGSFWRFILYTEILREIQLRFLGHLLRESGEGKKYASGLVEWIDANEELIKLDFVTRVNTVLERIRGIVGDDATRRTALEELLQSSRMYEIDRHLRQFSRQYEIRVLIDDLDRNWSPHNDAAAGLIVSLLNEILSLMANQRGGLKPAIFLRKDVFSWLERNDSELLKRDPGDLRWTRESLVLMVAKRIAQHTGSQLTDPLDLWDLVFPQHTHGERTPFFITDRTLQRPRDVIEFCQHAVEQAQRAGRTAVAEDDVYEAWEPSGANILTQAHTEYQHRFPALADLVLALFERPIASQWSVVGEALSQRAKKVGRADWLEKGADDPHILLDALYEAGLLGVETPGGSRWFQEIRPLAELDATLDEDFTVLIHPAFHRYLRCVGT